MLVHVINKNGEPLMPCSPRKARILLKGGVAVPTQAKTGQFTIQLRLPSSGYKQPVVVGIDPGAKRAPVAAVSNGKILYAKEKILRTDVKKQLADRARYRRNRRNRLRYRKPRFDNRTKTKCSRCGVNNVPKAWKKVKRKDGKSYKKVSSGRKTLCRYCEGKKGQHKKPHILAPSVKNRADSILRDVDNLAKSLPVTEVVVEIASFDTQKMADANIEGVEYQQGTLFGYEVKQYLLTVHHHKCAYCGGLSGDPVLEIEHIYPKSKGGTDKVSNLTVSCRVCNEAKGSQTLAVWKKKLEHSDADIDKKRMNNLPAIEKQAALKKGFQYSALTQSYKNYLMAELYKRFPVSITYGAKTKYHRVQLELGKSQINDAMVIASEGNPFQIPDSYILEKQIKKRRPAQYISPCKAGTPIVKRVWDKEVFGYRLWDRVSLELSNPGTVVGYVTGRRQKGSFGINSLDGDKITGGISYKKLELVHAQVSNYVRETRVLEISETRQHGDWTVTDISSAEQLMLF